MKGRRMPRGRGQGRVIDYKHWNAIPSLNLKVGTAATSLGGGLSFVAPATILRARGYVSASFDATQQAGDEMLCTFGLAVISTDAFTAGGGSVPDPADEPEYPWLWWKQMFLESFVAANEGAYGVSAQYAEVDTRAMRRIKPGETLCWVMQRTGVVGAIVTSVMMGNSGAHANGPVNSNG